MARRILLLNTNHPRQASPPPDSVCLASFDSAPRLLAEGLKSTLGSAGVREDAIQELLTGSLTAAIIEPGDESERSLVAIGIAEMSSASGPAQLRDGTWLAITNPSDVIALGSLLVWKTIREPSKISTENRSLMDSIYFPTQLAKDGQGIFFEERIASRLTQMGLLRQESDMIKMIDLGGWQGIAHLDAGVEVVYRDGNVERSLVLRGLALAAPPPLRPELQERYVRDFCSHLHARGIRTAVVSVAEAVVYHLPSSPLAGHLTDASNVTRPGLIRQCAELAGLLDADPSPPTDLRIPEEVIAEYLISDLDRQRHHLIDYLGLIDGDVRWCGVAVCPWLVRQVSRDKRTMWEQIASFLTAAETANAYDIYLGNRNLVHGRPA